MKAPLWSGVCHVHGRQNCGKVLVFLCTKTLFCQAEPDVSLGLECFILNLAINQPGVTHRDTTESVGWYLTAGLPLGLGWDFVSQVLHFYFRESVENI